MTSPPLNLEQLTKVAEAASLDWITSLGIYQGPDAEDDLACARGPLIGRGTGEALNGEWLDQAKRDRTFIATFNPSTVLALIGRIREMEKRWEQLKAWNDLEERLNGSDRRPDVRQNQRTRAQMARLEGDDTVAIRNDIAAMSYEERVCALRKPEIRAALGMSRLDSPKGER